MVRLLSALHALVCARAWTHRGSGSWETPRALQVRGGDVLVAGDTRGALETFENRGERDVFVMKFNSSGHKVWQTQRGCTRDDYAMALAVDSQSDLIVAGYTGGSLDGNVHLGVDDLFVMKLNSLGEWLWTHQRGTRFEDRISSAQVTVNDDVLLAGHTKGSLDGNANQGESDIFLMMLDSQGQWQWTQQRGSTGDDYVAAFELDAAGAYLLAGFTDASLDGNVHHGLEDLFVTKLDAASAASAGDGGAWRWTTQRGTRYEDRATAMQVTLTEVFVTGYTRGSLDGNANFGDADLFLMKLAASGEHLWTRQLGTQKAELGSGLLVTGSGLMLVGHTQGSLAGSNMGMDDILVQSFDPNGTHLWTRQTGSYDQDVATAIAGDGQNEAFLVGYVGRQSQLFISALSTLPAELASTASPRRATRVVLGAVLGVVATAM